MDKFEIGEIAILLSSGNVKGITQGNNVECEIIGTCYDDKHGFLYRIEVPGDPGPYNNGWLVMPINLRKKNPPQESKDIRDTREKGAPSFDKMMEDLMKKPVRVEE